jgi:glycosyltransferase involved in cell wall biosynthesis
MKIMIVHNRYRSTAPSGENRVVDTEAGALTALGHEVVRFERHSDDIETWSRARKAVLPGRVVWSAEAHRDLAARLREDRPDVVHVHNTFPLLSPAVLHACRDAGVPVVATIHNYKLACASGDFFRDGAVCHDCAGRLPGPAIRHGCYRGSRAATAPVALAMTAHRRAWRSLISAYIFISAAQRDLLTGLRLDPDRVFVRHNLIPPRAGLAAVTEPGSTEPGSTEPGTPEPGSTEPAAGTDPVVVYAGRLDEAKGVRLLMAGWDHYRAAAGDGAGDAGLRLQIVGAGPLDDEVAAWAASRPSVELAGQVDAGTCARLMSRARAVLLPSAWEETFGLVVVEAMALGVPPVATAHGSFTELITDGVDGVLFRPGDPAALGQAVADVAAEPARYATYGRQARETYAKRFDPERNLDQLIEIYRYAIDHRVLGAPDG